MKNWMTRTTTISSLKMTTSSDSSDDTRIISLDIFKGAAVLAVAFVHIALLQHAWDVTGTSDPSSMVLPEYIYSGLAMFIVISGYFYKTGKGFMHHLKKRILPMVALFLILVVVLNSVMCIYMAALGYDLSAYSLWDVIINTIVGKGVLEPLPTFGEQIMAPYEVTHLFYFLQIIISGSVVFFAIADRVLDDKRKLVATVAVLVLITALCCEFVSDNLPFRIHMAPLAAALMLVGAYMGKIGLASYLENCFREKRCWVGFIVVTVIGLIMVFFFPTTMSLIFNKFGLYGGWSAIPYFIIVVTCGTSLMFVAALASKIGILVKVLSFYGRNCLVVYVIHMFLAKLFVAPFVKIDTVTWLPLYSMFVSSILAFVVIAVSGAISEVVRRMSHDKMIG